MKLNEVKQPPPFGVYSCEIWRGFPQDITRKMRKEFTDTVYPEYARTSAQLLKYLKTRYKRKPITRVTTDGMVVKVSFKGDTQRLFWINHTGLLDSWDAVRQYYGLSRSVRD